MLNRTLPFGVRSCYCLGKSAATCQYGSVCCFYSFISASSGVTLKNVYNVNKCVNLSHDYLSHLFIEIRNSCKCEHGINAVCVKAERQDTEAQKPQR